MIYWRLICRFIVFVSVLFFIPPLESASFVSHQKLPDWRNMDLYETLLFIHELESGYWDHFLTQAEEARVLCWLGELATHGELEQHKGKARCDLEQALQENTPWMFLPTSFQPQYRLTGGFGHLASKVGQFINNHRTEIIIGVVVVIGATVIGLAAATYLSAGGTAAAVEAVGATGGAVAAVDLYNGSSTNEVPKLPVEPPVQTWEINQVIEETKQFCVDQNLFQAPIHPGTFIDAQATQRTLEQQAFANTQIPFFNPSVTCTSSYFPPPNVPYTSCFYENKGDIALELGHYSLAAENYQLAFEHDPRRKGCQLQAVSALFEGGELFTALDYLENLQDRSMNHYLAQHSDETFYFTKGLVKGGWNSGVNLFCLGKDLACHPVDTIKQLYNGLGQLYILLDNREYAHLLEALSPKGVELYQKWNTLTESERWEYAGEALGQVGGDILIPGKVANLVGSGVKGANLLLKAEKEIHAAHQVLVLSHMDLMMKSSEALGALESKVIVPLSVAECRATKVFEEFVADPYKKAQLAKFSRIHGALNDYRSIPMPEAEIRGLIQRAGGIDLPRPPGIPESYNVCISKKGAGMVYSYPGKQNIKVRVMPAKPFSDHPSQCVDYCVVESNGKFYDKYGNFKDINKAEYTKMSDEIHIKLTEYNPEVFKDVLK